MKDINNLLAIDLGKLYYPNFLIYFVVSLSFLIILSSMVLFIYTHYKSMGIKSFSEYKSNQIILMITGSTFTITTFFLLSVFRFSHFVYQTIDSLF